MFEFLSDAGNYADIGPPPATDVRVDPLRAGDAANMTEEPTPVPTTADSRATAEVTSQTIGEDEKDMLATGNGVFDAGRCNPMSTLVKDISGWDNFSHDDIQQKTVLGQDTADVYKAQILAPESSNLSYSKNRGSLESLILTPARAFSKKFGIGQKEPIIPMSSISSGGVKARTHGSS